MVIWYRCRYEMRSRKKARMGGYLGVGGREERKKSDDGGLSKLMIYISPPFQRTNIYFFLLDAVCSLSSPSATSLLSSSLFLSLHLLLPPWTRNITTEEKAVHTVFSNGG